MKLDTARAEMPSERRDTARRREGKIEESSMAVIDRYWSWKDRIGRRSVHS